VGTPTENHGEFEIKPWKGATLTNDDFEIKPWKGETLTRDGYEIKILERGNFIQG
jgi:hypothetical protein